MTLKQPLESPYLIPESIRQKIDKTLKKFPSNQKQSAVKTALMAVQVENGGWLTKAGMNAVADYLEMPRIAVYEVASFYTLFELEPVGRHKISVCTNISCLLCGSDTVTKHLHEKLGIRYNETTPDGRFTLKEVECLGACCGAPMMQIGDQYYENLTPEKIDSILAELE